MAERHARHQSIRHADANAGAAELARLMRRAKSIVAFTGAGISTEAGIPDFRSAGSPWLTNKPIPFDVFVASAEARKEAWRRLFNMRAHFRDIRPTRAHQVLANLVAIGVMPAVITQNIDGLHQASGIRADCVIELHGNSTFATCLDCGLRHELDEIRIAFEATGEPATCRACGGIVKTATISFGQAMPENAMRRAQDLALQCDLFLAIGSSLVVYPAATIPILAKSAGASLVIVNREPTEQDAIADLVINADIGDVFSSAWTLFAKS